MRHCLLLSFVVCLAGCGGIAVAFGSGATLAQDAVA